MKQGLNEKKIQAWIRKAEAMQILSENRLCLSNKSSIETLLYPDSINSVNNATLAMIKLDDQDILLVIGEQPEFRGVKCAINDSTLYFCALSHENAESLRELLSFTAPSPLCDKGLTFGVGDRLGVAAPGHIKAFKEYEAYPVFAQQSLRELGFTGRDYEMIVDVATWAVFREGYKRQWGADGDHLKTVEWVKKALESGCTMITADVSDHIANQFTAFTDEQIIKRYEKLPFEYRKRIESEYLDKAYELDIGDTVFFSKESLCRTALIYVNAIEYAKTLYEACLCTNKAFDFEFSIDETLTPTTPQAHIFVASETIKKGVVISSLAPRFVGEFQKGIDYIGDITEFKKAFITHAAIARRFGYRISVHSGSDKFSVFPIVGRETKGRFHIKTSGTNWLCALEVIAQTSPQLFLRLCHKARSAFDKARSFYHVTPDMSRLSDIEQMGNDELIHVLDNKDDRRILHITYGEILNDQSLGDEFRETLNKNIENYYDVLYRHIGRHLEMLGVEKSAF